MSALLASTFDHLRAAPIVLDDRPGSYRWWYFDALSADGETSIVVIFFVGSVFSPYYAARLAQGENALPTDHVAVNVAIYRRGQRPIWAFSEYGADRLHVTSTSVAIAGSSFERRIDGSILVKINERRTLSRAPVVGEVVVAPSMARLPVSSVKLAGERHQWRPIAPRAQIRASFSAPSLELDALGYHDENWGSEPPARAMASWSWGRAHFKDRTRVFFDTLTRAGSRKLVVLDSHSGADVAFPEKRRTRPSLGSWLLPLPASFDAGRCDAGRDLHLGPPASLERAPFYLRFVAPYTHPGGGVSALGVAEHVDFTRFADPVVQRMIALRVARPDRGDPGLLP